MSEIRKLATVDELDELLGTSGQRDVLLFKHSLTCYASTSALDEFRRFVESRPAEDPTVYCLIEIQHARDVSRLAAERTGVRHESPQVILVRRGAAAWNASHWQITGGALAAALAS